MSLFTKERSIFAGIILILIGIVAYGAIWFDTNYVLMPVPKESIHSVGVCISNSTACDLIYESTDEIPDELE